MAPDDAASTAPDPAAATVVLLRDGDAGPEVLLARRPDHGSFAGAWVFPGGAVDEADRAAARASTGSGVGAAGTEDPAMDAARAAAVRELVEETALAADPVALVPFARWFPPKGAPKPLVTWFFATPDPGGELALAAAELVESVWIRPADALARHAAGELILFPPTWVTLDAFAADASLAAALDRVRIGGVETFRGRFRADRLALYWEGDERFALDPESDATPAPGDPAASTPDDAHPAGPARRLLMDRTPWLYLRRP
ncbi:NUDIX domain-containing protein [Agromyces archimandritae]|uniref:NUDIX domain-containing protein n=1 Tax=Agromyces archimandritae TaxID=2781962 RepID=UPI001FD52E91|nr:NUDIX hydrolase [Agromyces archimandritae]